MPPKAAADAPPGPRKRPVQPRARATVRAILDAAAHILERGGEAALNTNGIAERAGVSIGSLYQYFPGKDAILGELIREKAEGLADAVEAAADEDEPGAALQRMLGVAAAQQLGRPRLARALDAVEERLPVGPLRRAAEERIGAALARTLVAFGVPAERAPVAATDLFGMVRGLTDTAAARGLLDGLDARVASAAFGYLRERGRADGADRPASPLRAAEGDPRDAPLP